MMWLVDLLNKFFRFLLQTTDQTIPGTGIVDKTKSMVPVCYCGEDRASCGACGRGYAQESAAGRSPKMIEKKTEPIPIKPKAEVPGSLASDMISSFST